MRRLTLLLGLILTLFAAPAVAQTAAPFTIVNDLLVLKLRVQGREVLAVVDTGAQGTVIDAAYARSLGLRAPGTPGTGGRGGRGPPRSINDQAAVVAPGVRFQLGGQAYVLSPGVTDLGPSVVTQLGVHVVLGRELFEAFVVELDFERRQLTLHARQGFTPPKEAILIPLTRKAGPRSALEASLRIEDGPPLLALIDTGDPRAVGLNQTTATRLRLDNRPSDTYRGYGVNVTTEDKVVTAAKVAFGGVVLTQTPLAIISDSTPVFGDDPARIGLPLLARFRVWMDFGADRMWLAPTSRTYIPFRKDTLGFGGQLAQGRVHIDRVAPRSPASTAGLKPGDIIVAVNGQQPQAFLSERPWNLLTPLNLKLGDGRTVLIRPAEFY